MSNHSTDLGPSIRRANGTDAAAIAALINCASQMEHPHLEDPGASESEIRRLQEQGLFLVLDRRAGGLAAAIYVEMCSRRGRFDRLSVAPDFRGNGLSQRLVAVAEALCEAEGCTAMDLQLANPQTELPPWYRSLGYREHGAAAASHPGSVAERVITMTKALA